MKLPLAFVTGLCIEAVFHEVWEAIMKHSNQSSVLACEKQPYLTFFLKSHKVVCSII